VGLRRPPASRQAGAGVLVDPEWSGKYRNAPMGLGDRHRQPRAEPRGDRLGSARRRLGAAAAGRAGRSGRSVGATGQSLVRGRADRPAGPPGRGRRLAYRDRRVACRRADRALAPDHRVALGVRHPRLALDHRGLADRQRRRGLPAAGRPVDPAAAGHLGHRVAYPAGLRPGRRHPRGRAELATDSRPDDPQRRHVVAGVHRDHPAARRAGRRPPVLAAVRRPAAGPVAAADHLPRPSVVGADHRLRPSAVGADSAVGAADRHTALGAGGSGRHPALAGGTDRRPTPGTAPLAGFCRLHPQPAATGSGTGRDQLVQRLMVRRRRRRPPPGPRGRPGAVAP
jgi:hypothetical protein